MTLHLKARSKTYTLTSQLRERPRRWFISRSDAGISYFAFDYMDHMDDDPNEHVRGYGTSRIREKMSVR